MGSSICIRRRAINSFRTLVCLIGAIFFLAESSEPSSNKLTFSGEPVPRFVQVGSNLLFDNSDSLFLNGRLLERDKDYTYSRSHGGFDLSQLAFSSSDTLVVSYRSAPNWLAQSFGASVPEIAPGIVKPVPAPSTMIPKRLQTAALSDISISGAKTFRFTTQSTGTSEFGQSLDLSIGGNLSSDLTITGAISDRGFNPSYGTSNSRLEELDKVNLKLESNTFKAQVGDIVLAQGLLQRQSGDKKISGALVNVTTGNFNFSGVAARPKGRFSAVRFTGNDGVQGPYQVGEGAQAKAIVPNSETVWLDGQKLVRGSDNDYTLEYPTGRITFTVKHLIDRRSRIEIDYEPVVADYKTELFSTGSAYKVGDSSLFAAVEWYREGDVRDQPQLGELSSSDRQILESAGDNIEVAVRSGARADTSGNYIIIPDSLPDTVFQYVGDPAGNYSVTFSFVGTGKGYYKFVGGDQYVYAGVESGDYQPIVKLPAPERTDFYSSSFGVKNNVVGSIRAEISLSQLDKNLYSSLDDHNNDGILLNFDSRKEFRTNGQTGNLSFRARMKEASFDERSRLNGADFNRQYFTPINFVPNADERLYEAKSEFAPLKNVTIRPYWGRLNYKNSFSSDKFEIGTLLGASDKLNGSIFWGTTDAELAISEIAQGQADNWRGTISSPIIESIKLTTEYEHDKRENNYSGNLTGLRFDRYAFSFDRTTEKITYERFIEDTLSSGWSESLNRNRISGSSNRRFGDINYTAYLGYQWIQRLSGEEESFLGRTGLNYNDNRKQISAAAAYSFSEETRNARGLTYLEVEPGQGNYSNENGRYVPDPNGNFIQVEELLSDQSRVNRGEKSFQINKNWRFVQCRFNSNIEEELLEDGKRQIWWFIPFLSDDGQPYLVYNRSYNSEIRLAPIKGGHAVNIALDERTEIRSIAGATRSRRDRAGALTLKQAVQNYFLEEKLKLFFSNRDNYFIGAGNIDGYQTSASIRRLVKSSEYKVGAGFRRAKSALNEISEIISVTGETRLRLIEKGELHGSLELYRQNLQNITGVPSFQLTDNKFGSKGAIWSTGLNYNVRKGMRINFNLSGRHSNETKARLVGRTEVVAEF